MLTTKSLNQFIGRNLVAPGAMGKILFLFCFAFLTRPETHAQLQIASHLDMGSNNVSEGLFIRHAIAEAYEYDKFIFKGGLQFDLKSPFGKYFTGSYLEVGRNFEIKNFPISAQAFFIYNPFSQLVKETNWGISATARTGHFFYRLGTNFRTYALTSKAKDIYDGQSSEKIHENWNVMYLVGYNLKPSENNWNVGITFTNIDRFIISQDTNPAFYLHGKYNISDPWSLYAEAWYKSAGAFNISVNYFGFFFRTGIIWTPELSK